MFELSKRINLLLALCQKLPGFWMTRVLHIYANSSKGRDCPYGKMAEKHAEGETQAVIAVLKQMKEAIESLLNDLEAL